MSLLVLLNMLIGFVIAKHEFGSEFGSRGWGWWMNLIVHKKNINSRGNLIEWR